MRRQLDPLREVETRPAFEIHLGEAHINFDFRCYERLVIIWINGKRWQGYLRETDEATKETIRIGEADDRTSC